MVGQGFGGVEGSGGYLDDMKSDVADLKNAGVPQFLPNSLIYFIVV